MFRISVLGQNPLLFQTQFVQPRQMLIVNLTVCQPPHFVVKASRYVLTTIATALPARCWMDPRASNSIYDGKDHILPNAIHIQNPVHVRGFFLESCSESPAFLWIPLLTAMAGGQRFLGFPRRSSLNHPSRKQTACRVHSAKMILWKNLFQKFSEGSDLKGVTRGSYGIIIYLISEWIQDWQTQSAAATSTLNACLNPNPLPKISPTDLSSSPASGTQPQRLGGRRGETWAPGWAAMNIQEVMHLVEWCRGGYCKSDDYLQRCAKIPYH